MNYFNVFLFTKQTLYGNIYLMNKFSIYKNRILFIAILALISAVSFCLGNRFYSANALSSATAETELFLPNSKLEYDDSLASPQDVYFDEEVCAVIQNNGTELLISKNGGAFVKSSATFTSLQQVKKLDDKTLIVSDEAKIYKIDLESDTFEKEALKYGSENVTCNLFDYKDGIFIGNFGVNNIIYSIENGVAVSKFTMTDICNSTPVCVNDGVFYYVNKDSKLCKRTATFNGEGQLTNEETELTNLVPTRMITDGTNIYALKEDKIIKIDVSTKAQTELSFLSDNAYELGKIQTATGLCFKNGNLLICDYANNTLQEFKIENDKLAFTGYAVASGKTAFNRIGKSADEIEFNSGRVAVLNTAKKTFTVINDANGSFYDKNNFSLGFVFNESDAFTPNAFALGEKSALLVDKNSRKVKLYDFSKSLPSSAVSFDDAITDVAWQNGKYYISQLKWDDAHTKLKLVVSVSNELEANFNAIIETEINSSNYPLITIDVFENVYVTDAHNNRIAKFVKTQNGYGSGETISLSPVGIKKITTDLAGGLFALTEKSVIYYDQAENKKHTFPLEEGLIAKSFANSFESNRVFFIYENQEFCNASYFLPILALNEITVGENFHTDGKNGIDLSCLKIYGVKEGANVYSLTRNGNSFEYMGLKNTENLKGAFICDYTYAKNFVSNEGSGSRTEKFIFLASKSSAGFSEIYLVNQSDAVQNETETFDSEYDAAFATTGVRVYYFPIITQDAAFTLKNNGEIISLSKGDRINIVSGTELFGNKFYYASITLNGETIYGYIPTNFTAKYLYQNYPEVNFTTAKVYAVNVYEESALTTLKTMLEEGTEVRIIEKTETYVKISYKAENGYEEGYVSATDSFMPVNNDVLRNVLIILAITVSVCITSIFLILRKKS